MEALLATGSPEGFGDDPAFGDRRRSVLAWVRSDPGRVRLESVLEEVGKLGRVGSLYPTPARFTMGSGAPCADQRSYRPLPVEGVGRCYAARVPT